VGEWVGGCGCGVYVHARTHTHTQILEYIQEFVEPDDELGTKSQKSAVSMNF
jgi:hypothetical protein